MTVPDPAHIEEWGKGMWTVFDGLAKRPRSTGATPEQQLALLHEEAEVVDLFRRYHYLYDAGDIDGVMELFTDDCVVVNPRGTYVGAAAVRDNYEYLTRRRRFVIHVGTNTLVRFEQGMREAWLGAFYYATTILPDDTVYAVGGTYADRLRKDDGSWKVFEQRITFNYRADLQRSDPAMPPPPTATSARTSGDLIEPEMVQ